MAVPFNRLEQLARVLIHRGVLPMAVGRAVPQIGADKLLALVAAAAFADRIIDAPAVASAFHGLPEVEDSNSGALTFGAFFAGVMADRRPDAIEIEFIRVTAFDRRTQFVALVHVNDNMTFGFGEALPERVAREDVVRITPQAFEQMRRDFNGFGEQRLAREFAR